MSQGPAAACQAANARASMSQSRFLEFPYPIENTAKTSTGTASHLRRRGRVVLEKSLVTHHRVFWPRHLPDL
jgi:hypothetical protein